MMACSRCGRDAAWHSEVSRIARTLGLDVANGPAVLGPALKHLPHVKGCGCKLQSATQLLIDSRCGEFWQRLRDEGVEAKA